MLYLITGATGLLCTNNATRQDRRDCTYTVPYVLADSICANARPRTFPYVPADSICATRDHEPWPGGESRKRDCLWRVPSPLEGRFPTPPLLHSQLTHFPQRPSRDGLRHSQPFGLSPPAKTRMRLRRTRTRLLRRLHEYSTTESRYCPFDVKAKVEQGPYDIIRVHSCRAQARIRARVERQADRPIAEKRRWRRRMPPGHATDRRD